jgi:hypothetical protein
MGDTDADRPGTDTPAPATRGRWPSTASPAPGEGGPRRGRRAQTTIDFAIGVGIFLIVVAFVIAFLPGVLQPFTDGGQEGSVTADRVASTLAGGMLGSPADPYALDTSCTIAFFEETDDNFYGGDAYDADACHFTYTDSFDERLGLGVRDTIDVTIESDLDGDGDAQTLCWVDAGGGDDGQIIEQDDGACDVTFTAGAGSPGQQSVVTARRMVSIDGTNAMLVVRSW